MSTTAKTIKEAIEAGEDATGLCTVRELVAEMISRRCDDDECWVELFFVDDAGRRINVEVAVTFVDGVLCARPRGAR